jgi:hypothetical protein
MVRWNRPSHRGIFLALFVLDNRFFSMMSLQQQFGNKKGPWPLTTSGPTCHTQYAYKNILTTLSLNEYAFIFLMLHAWGVTTPPLKSLLAPKQVLLENAA